MTDKELQALTAAFRLIKLSVGDRERTDDEKIWICGIYPEWQSGVHSVGEVFVAKGQVWECFQAYDNSVYPDITPDNSSWNTFNRPLHGKTIKTAMPFVAPTGAHDMYKSGEYMIYNGKIYLCVSDTVYTPDEYASAWQIQE